MQKGLWYCYTCGARGKTDGLVIQPELDLDFLDELLEEPRVLPEQALELYCSEFIHPYWLSRFSERACQHFQLGFDPQSGRPCYPLRDPLGQLLGIVTRNLEDAGPKYKYPRRSKIHNLLFNYSPVLDTVILVEGAMDVIAAYEAGFHAFGIFGSTLSAQQVRLLRQAAPDRVVLVFDNDRAGRSCARGAREKLDFTDVREIDWRSWEQHGDDLAELPLHARVQLLTMLTQP